jgi:hypothetical protein
MKLFFFIFFFNIVMHVECDFKILNKMSYTPCKGMTYIADFFFSVRLFVIKNIIKISMPLRDSQTFGLILSSGFGWLGIHSFLLRME